MTMWPLAASGGWPPARCYLHSESVNAQRMRPYMPGGRWRGGPYKRGTTVHHVKYTIALIFDYYFLVQRIHKKLLQTKCNGHNIIPGVFCTLYTVYILCLYTHNPTLQLRVIYNMQNYKYLS